MVLDLVCRWHDFGVWKELFEELDAVVCDADGLYFARLQQSFHLLPGLNVRPVFYEIARAIGKFWKLGVVAIGA